MITIYKDNSVNEHRTCKSFPSFPSFPRKNLSLNKARGDICLDRLEKMNKELNLINDFQQK